MLSLIGKFHRIGIVEWVDSSSCWTIEVLGTARRGKVCIKAWYLANLWGNKNEFINFFVQIMICKILANSELLIFFYYFEQKWNTEGFQLNWMELMTTDDSRVAKKVCISRPLNIVNIKHNFIIFMFKANFFFATNHTSKSGRN